MEGDYDEYDYVIEGTNLLQALLVALLARKGYRVLVVDQATSYGGFDQTTNLSTLFNSFSNSSSSNIKGFGILELLENDTSKVSVDQLGKVNVSFYPHLLRCNSKWVDIIKSLDIGNYLEFKLANDICFLSRSGDQIFLPSSKEDVFNSDRISLVEKRKIMKFLVGLDDFSSTHEDKTWAQVMEEQKVPQNLSGLLFHCGGSIFDNSQAESTLFVDVAKRLNLYKGSLGIFGRGGYLDAMYGLGSELVQALARFAAVKGCVFALNDEVEKVNDEEKFVRTRNGHVAKFSKRVLTRFSQSRRGLPGSRSFSYFHQFVLLKSTDGSCAAPPSRLWFMEAATSDTKSGSNLVALLQGAEMGVSRDEDTWLLHFISQTPILGHQDTLDRLARSCEWLNLSTVLYSLTVKHTATVMDAAPVPGSFTVSSLNNIVLSDSLVEQAEQLLAEFADHT